MSKDKDPVKDSKGDDSARDLETPFFTISLQKGHNFALKGRKKGKNKGKDKVDIKTRAKAKGVIL